MSMKVVMGALIATGVGAAIFLVTNGFEGMNRTVESDTVESEDDSGDGSKKAKAKSKSNEEKFDNIEASIAANPRDRERAYKYGYALIGLSEFDRAERFYLEQLDLYPTDVKIAYGLGWCYEQQKKWEEAVQAYSKAVMIDRSHRDSKNNLAWILATAPESKLRDGRKAVALATQAVGTEHPPNPMLMDTLAAAYAEVGSFSNAVRIQRYVSRKTDGDHAGVEKRLKLYLDKKPYRMPK